MPVRSMPLHPLDIHNDIHRLRGRSQRDDPTCKAHCTQRQPSKDPTVPHSPSSPVLLARLDALTDLAHRANGLLLAPDGQLTRTDAAAAAHAVGLDPEPERNRGALE